MKKIKKKVESLKFTKREAIRQQLLNKYYNIFMSNYYIPQLDKDENNFIFRKFWDAGKVGALEIAKDSLKFLAFANFNRFGDLNYLDALTTVTVQNPRGISFLPTRPLEVGKDIICGYAQQNKKPIRDYIDYIICKMCDAELCLQKNLRALSSPFIIGASSVNEMKINAFLNKYDSDDDNLIFEFEDGETPPQLLTTGAPYIIDKLYNQIQAYDAEILTYLGVNNLGATEKKEHLITAETEANDGLIEISRDNIRENIELFIKEINKTFNKHLTLSAQYGDADEQEDEKDDNDNEKQ